MATQPQIHLKEHETNTGTVLRAEFNVAAGSGQSKEPLLFQRDADMETIVKEIQALPFDESVTSVHLFRPDEAAVEIPLSVAHLTAEAA